MSNLPSATNFAHGETDNRLHNWERENLIYPNTNNTNIQSGGTSQRSTSLSDTLPDLNSRKPFPKSSILPIRSPSQLSSSSSQSFGQYCLHWKWEFAASLIILACPAIITITLYPHAGQPLPQWPFRISINTLLSIYSLVFKTCLTFVVASCIGQLQWSWFSSHRPLYDLVRFDKATRGPWGSFQILCSQNIRHPLTVLGALILIAATAIDPFIQQLVSPFDCSVALTNMNATLPRTNQLDHLETYMDLGGLDSTVTEAAVRKLDYIPSNQFSWECSTGNCTFSETYGTMAYCSSCEDWSDKLAFSTTCYNATANKNTTSSTGDCADGLYPLITTSLYIGGLGVVYRTGDIGSEHYLNVIPSDWINATSNPVGDHLTVAETSRWRDFRTYAGFERAVVLVPKTMDGDALIDPTTRQHWTDCNSTDSINSWHCQGYGAAGCVIQPCVRKYNATIKAGLLEEHLVSDSSSSSFGNYSYDSGSSMWIGMIDTQCISVQESEDLTKKGYKIDNSTQWLGYNLSISANQTKVDDELASSLLSHHCLYLMNNPYSVSEINGAFPYWHAIVGEDLWGTMWGSQLSYNTSSLQLGTYSDGPRMLLDLYNNSNIEFNNVQETFSNLSDIMTAWIRTHGNSSYSDPALGEVLHYATCLRVRWPWVAFPATLAVLSLILLFAMMIVTEREGVPVWKSSPLAWIMRGPGPEFSSEVATTSEMEQKSKEIVVSLVKGTDPRIEVIEKNEFTTR